MPGSTPPHVHELKLRWEQDPGGRRLYLQLAEEYRKLGQLAEAESVLEKGLSFRQNDLSGLVALGRCRLELEKVEAAIAALETVIARDPTHIVANKLLVDAYLQHTDTDKAGQRLEIYRLLNDRDPELDHLEYRLRRLQTLAREQAPPADVWTVEEALAATPEGGAEEAAAPSDAAAPPAPPAAHSSEGAVMEAVTSRGTARSNGHEIFDLRGLTAPAPTLERLWAQPPPVARREEPFAWVTPPEGTLFWEQTAREGIFAGLEADAAPPAAESEPEVAPLAAVLPDGAAEDAEPAELEPPELVWQALEAPPLAEPADAEAEEAVEEVEAAEVEAEEVEAAVLDAGEEHLATAEIQLPRVDEPMSADDLAAAPDEELAVAAAPAPEAYEEPAAPLPTSTDAAAEAGEEVATVTLGGLYLKQGHHEEASRIFRKVLERDPENRAALAGLALAEELPQGELTAMDLLADRSLTGTIPSGLTAKKLLVLGNYLKHLTSVRRR